MFFRDYTRDNPVLDAEEFFSRENQRPVIGKCSCCGDSICGEDDYYEEDDAYLFDDGSMVCDDCLVSYCRQHFKI